MPDTLFSSTPEVLEPPLTSQPEINSMHTRVQELLRQVGPGRMPAVAYNTAWVARLGEIDHELSTRALVWLNEHQLSDGTWGAERPIYYHDRLVSTLAAMIALTRRGRRASDRRQIERGLEALERISGDVTERLNSDSNGPTVGFEMIVPTLVAEAESLGLIRHQAERILDRLAQQREKKLSLLKGKMINRYITASFSAEMAGQDGRHMLDVENLQASNGSITHSPSATAYFALYLKPGDQKALSYLHSVVDQQGGVPDQMPIDVFEAAWVLWNLSLINDWDDGTTPLFLPLLDHLKKGWKPGEGIGLSTEFSIPDGDDTCFVYEILSRFGEPVDIDAVLAFEEKECFRTFHFEANSSPSVNIHALGALRQAGFDISSSPIQKILGYLLKTRVEGAYWFDKWNLSPFYTTAHAIMACAGYVDEIVRPAVEWILQTQNKSGSWGFQFPSAEETAYCLQALMIWQRYHGNINKEAIKKAVDWLKEKSEPPYPPLWIGKGLYTPELVVHSGIMSALLLSERG